MKRLIYVNSAPGSRDPGGTDEDFTITVSPPVFTHPPREARLVTATVPYSWGNITTSNNAFDLIDNGTHAITIAPGNYNAVAIATAIENALNASGGANTYTVTYSHLRFTIAGNGSFQLDFSVANSIAARVGFDPELTAQGTSFTSPNLARLVSDTEIFICSDLVSGVDNGVTWLEPGALSAREILAVVPLTTCFGGLIHYSAPADAPYFSVRQSAFASGGPVRFYLEFPSGDPVDLQGIPWTATLEFRL